MTASLCSDRGCYQHAQSGTIKPLTPSQVQHRVVIGDVAIDLVAGGGEGTYVERANHRDRRSLRGRRRVVAHVSYDALGSGSVAFLVSSIVRRTVG